MEKGYGTRSEHPDALTTAANLAATLLARGDAPAAEEMQRDVLRVLERDRGVGSPEALMVQPTPATHSILTGLKAGETVYETF